MTTDDDLFLEGGGYAGLLTARICRKIRKKIPVSEARNRMGGPVLTSQCNGRQHIEPVSVHVEPTWRQSIISLLTNYFGEEASTKEEWNRHGHSGIMQQQSMTRLVDELRLPVDDIPCFRKEPSSKGNGYREQPLYQGKELRRKFWKVFNL